LKAAVDRHLPVVAPPQMVSTANALRDEIVELAKKGSAWISYAEAAGAA